MKNREQIIYKALCDYVLAYYGETPDDACYDLGSLAKEIEEVLKLEGEKVMANFTARELEIMLANRKWELYLAYLVHWAAEHVDNSNYGSCPAGFSEWEDNEYQELIDCND